jgi:small GTP-binding protein
MDEFEYLFFIAVLGSNKVGKKTLAKSRFLKPMSHLDYMLTIGVEFATKTVVIDITKVKLAFRILSSAQRFWDKSQRVNCGVHVRSSNGAIILYDLTDPTTIEKLSHWIQIVKDNAKDIPILLVGNKFDLKQQREVSKEQIEQIENQYNINSTIEISLKTGENVESMILNLTRLILKK